MRQEEEKIVTQSVTTAIYQPLAVIGPPQPPQVLVKRTLWFNKRGPGSAPGTATGYGLDGPGIESRWGGQIFRTCPDRPWGPPSLLYNGYRVFTGVKERPRRDADPSPPSSAIVMKG